MYMPSLRGVSLHDVNILSYMNLIGATLNGVDLYLNPPKGCVFPQVHCSPKQDH